jgi:hypothetical protein
MNDNRSIHLSSPSNSTSANDHTRRRPNNEMRVIASILLRVNGLRKSTILSGESHVMAIRVLESSRPWPDGCVASRASRRHLLLDDVAYRSTTTDELPFKGTGLKQDQRILSRPAGRPHSIPLPLKRLQQSGYTSAAMPASDGRVGDNNTLHSPSNSRHWLEKAVPGGMQISAPAPNDNNNLPVTTTTPRTPPVPPKDRIIGSSPTETLDLIILNSTQRRPDSSLVSSPAGGSRFSNNSGSSSGTTSGSSNKSNAEPPRKALKFQAVAKAAAKLLGSHRSSTTEQSPPTLPPLLYSFAVPIEQHVLAISARVKEEFKLKLNYELPSKDSVDEGEIIEELSDINNQIGHCAKSAAKLTAKAKGLAKKSLKSDGMSQIIERDMRTTLNQFMVTRIFQPFSIELDPEADKILRERYQEIAPRGTFTFIGEISILTFIAVPQFIAARWRVLASSSTSLPIQQLTTALHVLATEAASLLLGEFASDEKLSQELDTLLLPVIRHAYLLSHFIHLEMLAFDYDIFCGTQLGGWLTPDQEEERQVRSRVSRSEDSRVNGYWSLGLRKRRFVGQGTTQRRIWDVVLKATVNTENSMSPTE